MDECGPYVTKPGELSKVLLFASLAMLNALAGWVIPDWPKLLHLYSRFKVGKTVRDWMEEYDVHKLGIDVRRFTSFGVIKVSGGHS